jgi:hypothetical protein
MGTAADATRHAGGLYGRTFGWLRRPLRKVEDEAHHLREVEQVGASAETPFIAMLGLALFLVPLAAVLIGLGFGAAYLFA